MSKMSYSIINSTRNPGKVMIQASRVQLNRFGAPTGSSETGFSALFDKPADGGSSILKALKDGEFGYKFGNKLQNGLYELVEINSEEVTELEEAGEIEHEA